MLGNGSFYVQNLLGGLEGFITLNNEHYYPLPSGTKVTIT